MKKKAERARNRRIISKIKVEEARNNKMDTHTFGHYAKSALSDVLSSIGQCESSLYLIDRLLHFTETVDKRSPSYHTEELNDSIKKLKEGEKEVSVIKEGDFYGKWFCYSHEYMADSPAYNEQWIREVEIKAAETIMKKGVLMFNELQEMLGFDNVSNSLPFGWTDNDGFFLEFDEHVVWNEKLQMDEPQLYVRWTTPRNLYSTTSFKDLLKGT
jgi:hypothetical protein